jgi:hypothetical protein
MEGCRRELSKLKSQCVPQCNARTATFSRAARVQRFEVLPADADYGDRIAQRCALRTLATFGAVVNIPKLATCTHGCMPAVRFGVRLIPQAMG